MIKSTGFLTVLLVILLIALPDTHAMQYEYPATKQEIENAINGMPSHQNLQLYEDVKNKQRSAEEMAADRIVCDGVDHSFSALATHLTVKGIRKIKIPASIRLFKCRIPLGKVSTALSLIASTLKRYGLLDSSLFCLNAPSAYQHYLEEKIENKQEVFKHYKPVYKRLCQRKAASNEKLFAIAKDG